MFNESSLQKIIYEFKSGPQPERFFELLEGVSYDKIISHFGDRKYSGAAKEYMLLAEVYRTASDSIDYFGHLSHLKPLSRTLSKTAMLLEKEAKSINLEATKDKYIREGRELRAKGLYQEALIAYDMALNVDSETNDPYVYNEKGIINFNLGNFITAIDCYDKAIKLNPIYTEAWFNRGLALFNLGRYDESIECFHKTTDLKADYTDAWLNAGIAYSNLGKLSEALVYLDRASRIDPDNEEVWFNYGLILYLSEEYQRAIDCYQKVTDKNPKFAEAWFNKGLAYHNKKVKDYQKAIDCYTEALKIEPDSFIFKACKAEALLFCSRIEECESLCKVALSETDDSGYKFAIRLIMLCCDYLRELPNANEDALDILKFYESLPIGTDFNWLFDGLRDFIYQKSLGSNEKKVLLSFLDVPNIKTEEEKKVIIDKMGSILSERKLLSRIAKSLSIKSASDIAEKDIKVVSVSVPDKFRENRYYWEIYIDSSPKILSSIKQVRYTLHPAMHEKTYTSSDRENNFRLKRNGIGEFVVKVELVNNNGDLLTKYHWLSLRQSSILDQNVSEMNQRLVELVKMGKITEFNILRKEMKDNSSARLDLSSVVLIDKNLQGALFNHVFLIGAKLNQANLGGASFHRADIIGSDLSYANLTNADLSYANLTNADLSYANLTNADLSYANLTNTQVTAANLSNTNMSQTITTHAYLSLVTLFNADLSYANLTNADLSYANLTNADLSYANLTNADLSYSLIAKLKWNRDLKCEGANFSNCIINDKEFLEHIKGNGGVNIPESAATTEMELNRRERQLGFI